MSFIDYHLVFTPTLYGTLHPPFYKQWNWGMERLKTIHPRPHNQLVVEWYLQSKFTYYNYEINNKFCLFIFKPYINGLNINGRLGYIWGKIVW